MSQTEAQTRAELIDTLLAISGWNVNVPTQVVEEFDILTQRSQGVKEPRTGIALVDAHMRSGHVENVLFFDWPLQLQ